MSGLIKRVFHKAGSAAKTTLAVVGLVSIGKLYSDYAEIVRPEPSGSKKKHKRVLEIDFDKLDLVERKEDALFSNVGNRNGDRTTMEVRELISVLHKVASDDTIVGVYGKFNWMSLDGVGWADLEELRNALLVIQQSHRRHAEPNLDYGKIVIPSITKKFLYSYSDSFGSPADPSNKSYYVASAFEDVHLQQHGELSLFGNLSSVFFIRELLEKYKINVHVFKQGVWKTAPNMFTNYRFNKFHQLQMQQLHDSIQQDINNDIVFSRSKALLKSWLKNKDWKSIYNSGIFAGTTAWKAGLVDYLPRRDPLPDLIEYNGDDEQPTGWNVQETNFKKFTADSKVTLKDYAKQVKKQETASKKFDRFKKMVQKYNYLEPLASKMGLDVTNRADTIALIQVNGTIGDTMADSVMESLESIRKDPPKAIVLRVNSRGGSILACEKIQQELKGLNIPMVVSFGNYSASGGYYVSTPAERIFASRKTITGSIGVFGIRLDLTGLAAKYGINVEQIASSNLSATYSPMAPMTGKMKETFSDQIDRHYDRFKTVVAEGRDLDMDMVERLAQGQVYTGLMAKDNGIVDEVGGLHRAIAYAKRNYGENAEIEVYPKEKSFLQKLAEMKNSSDAAAFLQSLIAGKELSRVASNDVMIQGLVQGGIPSSGIFYSADENSALDCLLSSHLKASTIQLPDWFWDD